MDNKSLIEILGNVPARPPLQIYRLAWTLIGDDGLLDTNKIFAGVPELEEATLEANDYMKAVRHLRSVLECLQ